MTFQAIAPVPCPRCPFRKDVPIYLHAERREEIAESVRDGMDFYCHQTTVSGEDEEGEETLEVGAESSICAGAAKALMAAGGTTQMMRISERLGMADLDKIEERGAEVWDLDQWPRLAEGSTAEKPEWEVGDEHGVESCSVVNQGCEAPAGYMGWGGAVVQGTVEAGNKCEMCGEPYCDNCAGIETNYCYWCAPDDDLEEDE